MNQVAAEVVPSASKPVLQGFVGSHVAGRSHRVTPTGPRCTTISRIRTKPSDHSLMENVRGNVHTNGVESFWSMLKQEHKGIYHKMSPKHLDQYVQKFVPAVTASATRTQSGRWVWWCICARRQAHHLHRPYRTEWSFIGSSIMKKADRMEMQVGLDRPCTRTRGGHPRQAAGAR